MENQTDPIIIQTGQTQGKGFRAPTLPRSLPKVIFILLSLVIIGELIWGVWYLSKPRVAKKESNDVAAMYVNPADSSVAVKLSSRVSEVNVGDTVTVDVFLDGQVEDIVGVDLVLKYDPKYLSLEGNPPLFIRGDLFKEYLGEAINKNEGLFMISGISTNPVSLFGGEELFGGITFKALQRGNTLVQVSYKEGSTTESNVLQETTGEDIIDNISNLSLRIK